MSLLQTLRLRRAAEEAASDLPALMARAEHAVAGILHGDHAQRKPGTGEKFWQYRDYVPGDRPQDIDWRQSGKSDRVFIRQREWQTTQSAFFWCNEGASMDFASDKHIPKKSEAAKIIALALGILMIRAGEQIGLYGDTRTGRTELALQRISDALCDDVRQFDTLPDPFALKLPKHCSVLQIGDFLSPVEEIELVFAALSAQADSGLVVQVLDPAELELPFSGRVIFEEPAGGKETVNHVDSIRARYKERIENHLAAVRDICKRQHWHYVLHRTDGDISETLSWIWAALHRDATG